VKVAIPRMGESVAPCLEYSATIAIFTIEDGRIVDQIDYPIRSRESMDRIRLLRGAFDRAVQAQRQGDWARYGEELKTLEAILTEWEQSGSAANE